jgi:hypothetical protein
MSHHSVRILVLTWMDVARPAKVSRLRQAHGRHLNDSRLELYLVADELHHCPSSEDLPHRPGELIILSVDNRLHSDTTRDSCRG